MKKIIFMIHTYSNSGIERRVTNLSNEFVKNNYSVEIVVVQGITNSPFYYLHPDVKLVSVNEKKCRVNYVDRSIISEKPPQPRVQSERTTKKTNTKKKVDIKKKTYKQRLKSQWKKSKLIHYLSAVWYWRTYRKYFKDAKPDIVIPFGLNFLERVLASTKGINCKIFDSEMVAHERALFYKRPVLEYYYSLLKKVNGIIVQTHTEKDFFKKNFDNVSVINNPINPQLPAPYYDTRNKTIVNFCRLAPQKNIELLLDAFAKLHIDYPDYIVQIYGNIVNRDEKEYKRKLQMRIYDANLQDYFFILPPTSDIHQRVIESAMFVMSSDFEGISNSMLEAMAIGLPCVCTDCLGGGTREVMEDHENGLIVPMNDSEAMYKAMREYIENPDLAERCSKNAAKIREKLSVERISKQWIDVIDCGE